MLKSVSRRPFLRSPPFPQAAPRVAAVSVAGDGGSSGGVSSAGPLSAGAGDAALAAVRRARVGAGFWGPPGRSRANLVSIGAFDVFPDAPMGSPHRTSVLPRDALAARRWSRWADQRRIALLRPTADPWSLMAHAEALWCDEQDEVRLVAWFCNVPVYDLQGRAMQPADTRRLALRALGAATYRDCFAGEPCSILAAIEQLARWRDVLDGNRGIAAAAGIAPWKRRQFGRFLWDGTRAPRAMRPAAAIAAARRERGAVAAWPSRVPPGFDEAAEDVGVAVVQVEDGFVRSRGLGSDLNPPWSIVVDRTGIYYRPGRPSDLQAILATHRFDAPLLARAAALRETICRLGVSKYGDAAGGSLPPLPAGRRIVLAAGQVEDDLSVRFGGVGLGNRGFLAEVRAAEPDAFVIFRPHPDVTAGHRAGHVADGAALAHADLVDRESPLMPLIGRVDAVHVLSSLTGFEALLRGKDVVVHGQPFYSGWGLTRDLAGQPGGRGRRLPLEALVAGALILYPRYLDPVTRLPCTAELLVERLAASAGRSSSPLVRLRRMQGRIAAWAQARA